ncbi:MAG: gltK [Betaproteobacteria bacterium]|nr:gltK [Betaproteobacteria bacterium]
MNNLDFAFLANASTLGYLWKGLQYNFQLTVVAAAGGVIWGTLLALARLSSNKGLSLVASGYVNLMRSIPLLLVVFWFYFLSPVLIQWVTHADRPPQIGADRSAYVTFILFEGAYFCEIMRAGIQSIPRGQVGAAYAVGLNYWQAMRYVILPQAFRNMLPVLLTQTIILFQDTSLVSLLNVTDFIGASSKLGQSTGHLVEVYTFAAPIYFLICFALSLGVKRLQKKIAIIR